MYYLIFVIFNIYSIQSLGISDMDMAGLWSFVCEQNFDKVSLFHYPPSYRRVIISFGTWPCSLCFPLWTVFYLREEDWCCRSCWSTSSHIHLINIHSEGRAAICCLSVGRPKKNCVFYFPPRKWKMDATWLKNVFSIIDPQIGSSSPECLKSLCKLVRSGLWSFWNTSCIFAPNSQ